MHVIPMRPMLIAPDHIHQSSLERHVNTCENNKKSLEGWLERCSASNAIPCGLKYPLMRFAGDTKAGTLVGLDRYGNKYFENLKEELPLRTRWIDYKDYELD
ncbi:NADH-ubiquinone oxidoreductase subunit B17.2, partial [Erysiphe pulchra]